MAVSYANGSASINVHILDFQLNSDIEYLIHRSSVKTGYMHVDEQLCMQYLYAPVNVRNTSLLMTHSSPSRKSSLAPKTLHIRQFTIPKAQIIFGFRIMAKKAICMERFRFFQAPLFQDYRLDHRVYEVYGRRPVDPYINDSYSKIDRFTLCPNTDTKSYDIWDEPGSGYFRVRNIAFESIRMKLTITGNRSTYKFLNLPIGTSFYSRMLAREERVKDWVQTLEIRLPRLLNTSKDLLTMKEPPSPVSGAGCPVCLKALMSCCRVTIASECLHVFCFECLMQVAFGPLSKNDTKCPLCRERLLMIVMLPSEVCRANPSRDEYRGLVDKLVKKHPERVYYKHSCDEVIEYAVHEE